jgi:hypothetical protein
MSAWSLKDGITVFRTQSTQALHRDISISLMDKTKGYDSSYTHCTYARRSKQASFTNITALLRVLIPKSGTKINIWNDRSKRTEMKKLRL